MAEAEIAFGTLEEASAAINIVLKSEGQVKRIAEQTDPRDTS